MTEALRQAVQGLLKEQEQQKYQICALEGISPVLFFIHKASYICKQFCGTLVCVCICILIDSKVSRLMCEVLRGVDPPPPLYYLFYYSITKVAAGGPRAEGYSPGATPGPAEKGNEGPSEPGARAGPSPNTSRSTKVQCYQWLSPKAAE